MLKVYLTGKEDFMKRKIVAVLMAMVLMCTASVIVAEARSLSSYYDSLACETGTWTSFEDSQKVSMTSQFSEPDSGNAGVYFFYSDVGLPEDMFEWDETRIGEIRLYEADYKNDDDIVVDYIGYFSIRDNGLYRMNTYSRSEYYGSPADLEYESGLELYISVRIQSHIDDSTENVPAGLFCYQFWVD